MLKIDEELQAIASKKSGADVMNAADTWFALDVDDCDDYVGGQVGGVEVGLELAAKAMRYQEFFKITFGDYGDEDGIAIFVGSRNQVKAKLEALDDLDDA
jgi:hypothetical protein